MELIKVMLPSELRNELQKFLIYDQIQLTFKSLCNGVLCKFRLQLFDHTDDVNISYIPNLDEFLQFIEENKNYIDSNYIEEPYNYRCNELRCSYHKFIYSNKKITYIKFNWIYSERDEGSLLDETCPIKYKFALDEIQTNVLLIRLRQLQTTIKQRLALIPKSALGFRTASMLF